jgi:site-specific recombinase XerD
MTADGTQISVGDLRLRVPDFERAMKAAKKSPKTVGIYANAARRMIDFFLTNRLPIDAARVTREHVELFMLNQVEKWKPATTNQRYRSLAQFWKFLLEEGEIGKNGMERMKPPRVPEEQVAVISDDDLTRLLAAVRADTSTTGATQP